MLSMTSSHSQFHYSFVLRFLPFCHQLFCLSNRVKNNSRRTCVYRQLCFEWQPKSHDFNKCLIILCLWSIPFIESVLFHSIEYERGTHTQKIFKRFSGSMSYLHSWFLLYLLICTCWRHYYYDCCCCYCFTPFWSFCWRYFYLFNLWIVSNVIPFPKCRFISFENVN